METSSGTASLGDRIRQARELRGWRQDHLAELADISASYLSRIESGLREPTGPVLQRLAAALGASTRQLVTGVWPERAAQVRLALSEARLMMGTGRADDAEPVLARLADEAPEAGDQELAAEVRSGHAEALELVGRHREAIAVLEPLREGAIEGGERWFRITVSLLRCYRETGDLRRAADLGESALAALNRLGLRGEDDGIRVAVTLASVYYERGDVTRAGQLAEDAALRSEQSGSPQARAMAYWNASQITADLGDVPGALRNAERAVAMLGEGVDERNLARIRVAHASLLLRLSEPRVPAALRLLDSAEEMLKTAGGRLDLAYVETERARASLLEGDAATAHGHANRALELLGDEQHLHTAVAYAMRGRAHAMTGDEVRAIDSFRHAVLVLEHAGAGRRAARLWAELAGYFDEVGDVVSARDAYRAAALSTNLVGPETAASVAR